MEEPSFGWPSKKQGCSGLWSVSHFSLDPGISFLTSNVRGFSAADLRSGRDDAAKLVPVSGSQDGVMNGTYSALWEVGGEAQALLLGDCPARKSQ